MSYKYNNFYSLWSANMRLVSICLGAIASYLFIRILIPVIKWFMYRHILNKIPGPYSHYFFGNFFDINGTTGK